MQILELLVPEEAGEVLVVVPTAVLPIFTSVLFCSLLQDSVWLE